MQTTRPPGSSFATQASAVSGSIPQAARSMRSMVTCSSLQRLLNALLASSPTHARHARLSAEACDERAAKVCWSGCSTGPSARSAVFARRADQQTMHRRSFQCTSRTPTTQVRARP